MAHVPYSPLPSVAPSGPSGAFENISAPPGAFGGQIAGAEEKLGGQIGQTGDVLAQNALRIQDFNNVRDARNANNAFMGSLSDEYTKYASLEGKAAVDGYGPFKDKLNDVLQSTAKTLQSPQAQNDFLTSAQFSMRRMLMSASVYAAQQQKKSWTETNNASISTETQHSMLMQNDPTAITFGELKVEKAARDNAIHSGLGPEETESMVNAERGKYYRAVIESKLATPTAQGGGGASAMALFDSVKDKMDPTSILQVQERMRPILRAQTADAQLGELMGGAATGGVGAPSAPGVVKPEQLQNNVGNIRSSNVAWEGKGQPVGGFETFSTPEAGVKAAVTNLRSYARDAGGSITLGDAITKWAPPSENDTAAYIRAVSQETGIDANQPVPVDDPAKMAGLVKAMTRVEKGGVRFGDDVFQRGAEGAIGSTAVGSPESAAASTTPSPLAPDWSALERRALEMTAGDPEAQDALLGRLSRTRSRFELSTATERASLEHSQSDLIHAAEAGVSIAIPEDRIRRVFQPEQADRMVLQLQMAQIAGQTTSGMKWMSPDQVDGVVHDMTTGLGTISDTLRAKYAGLKGATVTTPAGPGQDAAVTETAEAYGMRHTIASMVVNYAQERAKALYTNAGAFVADEPGVAAAAHVRDEALKGNDPAAITAAAQNFARTSLAVQEHLGVPSGAQHVLQQGQAQAMTAQITQQGVDVKGQLDGLQRQWGDAWPKVFGDLVTLGKLPAAYQSVAVLDDPKDAALLARAISETSKGGKDWNDILGNAGGKPVAQGIRDNVRNDPSVQQLERSLSNSGASAQQIDGIVSSIETLGFAKHFYNQDSSAAQSAVTSFTGKYTFLPNGDARIPTDAAPRVTANAGVTLRDLSLDKIQVPEAFRATDSAADIKAHPGAPAASDYLLSIQSNPTWITAPKGDALWLLDGEARVVRDKAGKPISVPFSAPMPVPQAPDMANPAAPFLVP